LTAFFGFAGTAAAAVMLGVGSLTAGAEGALIFASLSDFFEQLTARNRTIDIRTQAQIAGK
jgi:hypothetical protein